MTEQDKQDIADIAEADLTPTILSAFPTDTASGSIASFSDGADNLPLKSLVININPIQDLHGQDSPYPAGGGKNKLRYPFFDTTKTANGVTFIDNGDGTLSISGTATSVTNFNLAAYNTAVLSEGDYVVSLEGGSSNCYFVYGGGDSGISYNTAYGTDVYAKTIHVAESGIIGYCIVQVPANATVNLTVKPMIRRASVTDATYAPYENICPISGWTEVQTNISGINVWDEEWEVGGISSIGNNTTERDRIRAKNYCSCLPSKSYYVRCALNTDELKMAYYTKDKTFISVSSWLYNGVVTTPANAYYFRVFTSGVYGTTYNHDISINYPSTDHDYHPYTGRSITINLGQTVYGGKLDVLSGKLTIDRAMVDLGTLNWEKYSVTQGNLFRYTLSSMQATPQSGLIPAICSNYKSVSQNQRTNATVSSGATTKNIDIIDNRYSDAVSFKTAMNGVQLVYELAEPIEIQLSANQLNSLYGVNNIWADSGDTTAEYRADTKLYIAKKIAEALASLT